MQIGKRLHITMANPSLIDCKHCQTSPQIANMLLGWYLLREAPSDRNYHRGIIQKTLQDEIRGLQISIPLQYQRGQKKKTRKTRPLLPFQMPSPTAPQCSRDRYLSLPSLQLLESVGGDQSRWTQMMMTKRRIFSSHSSCQPSPP